MCLFVLIPKILHDKAVQSDILRMNLNKINEISIFFYNQQIKKVTPRFAFMRRGQNEDTHALEKHRLFKNGSPVCYSFVLAIASDMHFEPESEKR